VGKPNSQAFRTRRIIFPLRVLGNESANSIACGIASSGSSDIEAIHGLRSERIEEVLGYEYGAEVVHRDNLVLL
jgi:glutamate 5-kinase